MIPYSKDTVYAISNSCLSRLSVYDNNYYNYCITGSFPAQCQEDVEKIKPMTLLDFKSQFFYGGGRPRISSTPLGVNSFYNRYPPVDISQYQTTRI
jgi:hypothetical protein